MKLTGAILLATLCWAAAAAAQGPPACKGDVQRFCPQVQPGGGRIVQCLRGHEAELSAACKDALAGMGRGQGMRGRAPWFEPCEADVGKLCQGVQPGGGRIHACLAGHRGELSEACRTALDQAPGRGGGGPGRGRGPGAGAAPAATAAPTPPAKP